MQELREDGQDAHDDAAALGAGLAERGAVRGPLGALGGVPAQHGEEAVQRFDPAAGAGDDVGPGGGEQPGEGVDGGEAHVRREVRHAGADVGQDLRDMVLDVCGWEGAEELEELRADGAAAVEEEGEERWEDDACWLGWGAVCGP